MNDRIVFKRGNTLAFSAQYKGGSIAGWQIDSQIRRADELMADLDITVTDADAGMFDVEYAGNTSTWEPTTYRCDIRYTMPNGHVISTDTFYIEIVKEITK